jgi:hypothetical protein
MAQHIRPLLSSTEFLRQGKNGLAIVRRRTRWTKERKAIFLEELGRNCNISAAERAAEVTPGSAWYERRIDPEFAEAWDAAYQHGYIILEQRLMELSLKQLKPDGAADAVQDSGHIDPSLAMRLLAAHQSRFAKTGSAAPTRTLSDAEVNAQILKQLLALRKRTADRLRMKSS